MASMKNAKKVSSFCSVASFCWFVSPLVTNFDSLHIVVILNYLTEGGVSTLRCIPAFTGALRRCAELYFGFIGEKIEANDLLCP